MLKNRLAIALGAIMTVTSLWVAPARGATHKRVQKQQTPAYQITVPAPIRFRDDRSRGLLVNAWIKGSGPYIFAIDTGAGVSLISASIVATAAIRLRPAKSTISGGLSGLTILSDQEATIEGLALGTPANFLPAKIDAVVAQRLPNGIDGILDPTEAFSPLGYSIDLPGHQMEAFDSATRKLQVSDEPTGGTVVRWIQERGSKRPFVRLGNGRLALVDTGSGFGLAVNEESSGAGLNHSRRTSGGIRDLGGGTAQSRRVGPTTVSIGSLVLRSVPTDLLMGTPADTPVILGRNALYPFRITFDPATHLIAIEPATRRANF